MDTAVSLPFFTEPLPDSLDLLPRDELVDFFMFTSSRKPLSYTTLGILAACVDGDRILSDNDIPDGSGYFDLEAGLENSNSLCDSDTSSGGEIDHFSDSQLFDVWLPVDGGHAWSCDLDAMKTAFDEFFDQLERDNTKEASARLGRYSLDSLDEAVLHEPRNPGHSVSDQHKLLSLNGEEPRRASPPQPEEKGKPKGSAPDITDEPAPSQRASNRRLVSATDIKPEDDLLNSRVIRAAVDDVGISPKKRPASLEEEEGKARKKQKLNTCLVVIQTVEMPGNDRTKDYKWNRRTHIWEATEAIKNGKVIIKKYELAERVTDCRVAVRPNGLSGLPVWMEWMSGGGYFEGCDLDESRLRINLTEMKRMIRSDGRGECTYFL